MFEKLISHCCNYQTGSGKCVGVFFKFDSGSFLHWFDIERADKSCVVRNNHYCKFLDFVVIPGIAPKSQTRQILKLMDDWRLLMAEQQGANTKICKKCRHYFVAESPHKRYCDACRKAQNTLNRRRATQRYKKKHWGDKNAPVTRQE